MKTNNFSYFMCMSVIVADVKCITLHNTNSLTPVSYNFKSKYRHLTLSTYILQFCQCVICNTETKLCM